MSLRPLKCFAICHTAQEQEEKKSIRVLSEKSCADSGLLQLLFFCRFSGAKAPEIRRSRSPDSSPSGEILANSKQEWWLYATFPSSARGYSTHSVFLPCCQIDSSSSQVARINSRKLYCSLKICKAIFCLTNLAQ